MFWSFHPLADKTNNEHLWNGHFSRSYENRSISNINRIRECFSSSDRLLMSTLVAYHCAYECGSCSCLSSPFYFTNSINVDRSCLDLNPHRSSFSQNHNTIRYEWLTEIFFSRYNLLFFINPQFYGYSAITKVLLKNNRLKCQYESTLNCISTEGNAVLSRFGFHDVNIYEHLAVS